MHCAVNYKVGDQEIPFSDLPEFVLYYKGRLLLFRHLWHAGKQRDLVRGFSFRLLIAIDIGLEVTKSAPPGGAAVNLNVNYINF